MWKQVGQVMLRGFYCNWYKKMSFTFKCWCLFCDVGCFWTLLSYLSVPVQSCKQYVHIFPVFISSQCLLLSLRSCISSPLVSVQFGEWMDGSKFIDCLVLRMLQILSDVFSSSFILAIYELLTARRGFPKELESSTWHYNLNIMQLWLKLLTIICSIL